MWEKFSRPEYRTLRAAVFVSLGLLSALPTIHVVAQVRRAGEVSLKGKAQYG
jgi:hypothetical protein